MSNDMQYTGKV